MFKHQNTSITKKLSGSPYSLVVSKKTHGIWFVLFALLALSAAIYAWHPVDASEEVGLRGNIEMLRNDRLRLEAELKQQGMSLEHEQATREALERQLNAQSEELKKVRKDLSFYRENAVRSGQ